MRREPIISKFCEHLFLKCKSFIFLKSWAVFRNIPLVNGQYHSVTSWGTHLSFSGNAFWNVLDLGRRQCNAKCNCVPRDLPNTWWITVLQTLVWITKFHVSERSPGGWRWPWSREWSKPGIISKLKVELQHCKSNWKIQTVFGLSRKCDRS